MASRIRGVLSSFSEFPWASAPFVVLLPGSVVATAYLIGILHARFEISDALAQTSGDLRDPSGPEEQDQKEGQKEKFTDTQSADHLDTLLRWRRPSPEEELGDGLELHVGRTLIDGSDLGVPIELLHRVLLGEPVATVEVDAGGRHSLSDSG